MPYIIVPKGQPNAWAYIEPIPHHHWRQNDWWQEVSLAASSSYSCSCCVRLIRDTGSFRMFSYDCGDQCEACIMALRDNPELPPVPRYSTRVEAVAVFNAKTQDIVFRPTQTELATLYRGQERLLASGEYMGVPWLDHVTEKNIDTHYAHLSYEHPGMVAFYRSVEDGITGKLTYVKPGRYLTAFYPRMSASDKARYIAEITAALSASYALAFTPEDITTIYNATKGPDSCMRRKDSPDYDWQILLDSGRMPCHPCAVYGNSDLALAYTGPIDSISQRAIVWPEQKRYIRVYGTGPLQHLLTRDGYTKASFKGAKIRLVRFTDPKSGLSSIVTPYVDRINPTEEGKYTADTADIDPTGKWLILRDDIYSGGVDLSMTRGHTNDDITCGDDSDNDDETTYCDACNESVYRDGYCYACWRDRFFTCDQCGHSCDRENEHPEYTDYCTRCITHMTTSCAHEDCEETFIEAFRPRSEQRLRLTQAVSHLCDAHATEAIEAQTIAAQTADLPLESADASVFEVQIRRPLGFLSSDNDFSRRRGTSGEQWYVVSNRRGGLSGSYDACVALQTYMRAIYLTSIYRIVRVPSVSIPVSPEVSSNDSPF